MANSKEQLEAAKRVCKTLDISLQQFMNRLDEYNKRVDELNKTTIKFAKDFLAPKGTVVNGRLEYDLTDDDKAILTGYKKKTAETLEGEFPDLFNNWEDVKIFEGRVNPDLYL